MTLYPLSFVEFLSALGNGFDIDFIQKRKWDSLSPP